MSYVAIWLRLHWRCAYFQTLSWNDTIFVVDWDILYKLCGSANKWSKGFIFSGKIWWQLFSCNKACSKYHTRSMTTPKYMLSKHLVKNNKTKKGIVTYRMQGRTQIIPTLTCHPGKNGNSQQMNARPPPHAPPYPMLFRITWELYPLVFRPKQVWIRVEKGAYFFCLEEMVVWCEY